MSVAMELMADCDVTLLERRPMAGGKARTWTDARWGVFREHSFRVFHDTYHNTFDTMSRIPTRGGKTVRDNLEAYVDEDVLRASYARTWDKYRDGQTSTRLDMLRNALDVARLVRLLTASDDRLRRDYATTSFADVFHTRADGTKGLVYQVLRDMSQTEYSADRVSPDVKVMINFIEKHFLHGAPGTGWNALVGPTNDAFIAPWRAHLEAGGVSFRTGATVERIAFDAARGRVSGLVVSGDDTAVDVDHYVAAVPSDVLLAIASPELRRAVPALGNLRDVRRVWNNGVIIYTSAQTPVEGSYYMWHPWRVAVTTYAARWTDDFPAIASYGIGDVRGRIRDIISYVICDWQEPGLRVRKPASECTPDEIYDELCYMSERDETVMPSFDRRDHVFPRDRDGVEVRCMVDDSLVYDDAGAHIVRNEDTLLHLPPGGFFAMPGATTPVANFALASTHCYNAFGCGDSMEGANETGRRAANAVLAAAGIDRRVPVFEGRSDSRLVRAFELLRKLDAVAYRVRRGSSR